MISVVFLSLFVAAADQFVKLTIRSYPVGSVVLRFPPVAEIIHCVNRGAAFSVFSECPVLLAACSILLICLIAYIAFFRMEMTKAGKLSAAMLLGGGIGNLIDRLVYGVVTDYIRVLFVRFPVFNLADIAITLSVIVLITLSFTGKLENSTGEAYGPED